MLVVEVADNRRCLGLGLIVGGIGRRYAVDVAVWEMDAAVVELERRGSSVGEESVSIARSKMMIKYRAKGDLPNFVEQAALWTEQFLDGQRLE